MLHYFFFFFFFFFFPFFFFLINFKHPYNYHHRRKKESCPTTMKLEILFLMLVVGGFGADPKGIKCLQSFKDIICILVLWNYSSHWSRLVNLELASFFFFFFFFLNKFELASWVPNTVSSVIIYLINI